jgi:hypothetical protein
MPMDVKALLNWTFEDVVQHYSERDTMLYALGLNFGSDPTDERELAFVYEADLVAVPSMAVVLGHPGFWARDPRFGIDWKQVLHGEQWLQVFRQLPASGHVIGRTRIEQISDKGAAEGCGDLFQPGHHRRRLGRCAGPRVDVHLRPRRRRLSAARTSPALRSPASPTARRTMSATSTPCPSRL